MNVIEFCEEYKSMNKRRGSYEDLEYFHKLEEEFKGLITNKDNIEMIYSAIAEPAGSGMPSYVWFPEDRIYSFEETEDSFLQDHYVRWFQLGDRAKPEENKIDLYVIDPIEDYYHGWILEED